jgi:hypothetical protein
MTWNILMQASGYAFEITVTGVTLGLIGDTLIRHWPRIVRTLRGNDEPGFVPLSPTASVLPLRTSTPPLRAVEADAQLADKAA